MTLRDEFEPIWSSLIHRSPFPTLDTVIKDLISEEACLDTHRAKHTPSSTNVLLLPRYLLNLSLLLKPHPIPLFITLLGHLGRSSAITVKSMVMLSLSVTDYSLSNLPTRTFHPTLFERPLKVPLLNFP